MEVHHNIKIKNTTWSRNPISGYISQGNEIRIPKSYLYSYVQTTQFWSVSYTAQYKFRLQNRVNKLWPSGQILAPVFAHKVLLKQRHTFNLYVIYDFLTTMTELSNWQNIWPTKPKTLLSGPLLKTSAHSCSRTVIPTFGGHHHHLVSLKKYSGALYQTQLSPPPIPKKDHNYTGLW